MEKETLKRMVLPVSLLDENTGQIDGLPANPREILKEKFDLLKDSIRDYPELMNYKNLKVYPYNGRYVVLDGNMRLRSLRSSGCKEAACVIVPEDTDIERLKAYVILSNVSFGRWDWDKLTKDWDTDKLPQWGLTLPTYDESMLDDVFNEEIKDNTVKVTVTIPDSLQDMKDIIKDDIKILLKDYTGIKIQ